jgi:nicotinate-nucleotide adenylyltransferase
MADAGLDVAVFGGSFDPPHVGHLLALSFLRGVAGFDRVVAVPVFAHAFDKELAPFEHRLRMCEIAFAHLRGVETSSVERLLGRPSYTLRTIREISRQHPDWRLRLAVGADVLADVHRWHAFDELVELARPYVLGRQGVDYPGAPAALLPDVSSTEVRRRLRVRSSAGSSAELEQLVPRAVLGYIGEHKLYG